MGQNKDYASSSFGGSFWASHCHGAARDAESRLFPLPQALLVLDDVWSRRVVDAFTVGCPLLVTTKDISVVDQLKVERTLVEVVEGLTLPETRRLFAEVFGVSERELPHQVDDIHDIHRGELPACLKTPRRLQHENLPKF